MATAGRAAVELTGLAEEILLHVLSFLDSWSLLAIAQTCRLFRRLVDDASLWNPELYDLQGVRASTAPALTRSSVLDDMRELRRSFALGEFVAHSFVQFPLMQRSDALGQLCLAGDRLVFGKTCLAAYDVATGHQFAGRHSTAIRAHYYEITAMTAVTRDLVLTASKDTRVALSHLPSQQFWRSDELGDWVRALEHVGSSVMASTRDGGLALLDIATGQIRAHARMARAAVFSLAPHWNPELTSAADVDARDGPVWYAGDAKGYVSTIDVRVGLEPVAEVRVHSDVVSVLRWCPFARTLVSASYDRSLALLDVAAGSGAAVRAHFADLHSEAIARLHLFASDGRRVLSASVDGQMHIVDIATDRHVLAFMPPLGSDDLAYWQEDDQARHPVLDVNSRVRFPISLSVVEPLGLALTNGPTMCHVWDVRTGACLYGLNSTNSFVSCLAANDRFVCLYGATSVCVHDMHRAARHARELMLRTSRFV